jgi:hypothetical protein
MDWAILRMKRGGGGERSGWVGAMELWLKKSGGVMDTKVWDEPDRPDSRLHEVYLENEETTFISFLVSKHPQKEDGYYLRCSYGGSTSCLGAIERILDKLLKV